MRSGFFVGKKMNFKEVSGHYDGPTLELQVLEFWRENKIFKKTLKNSSGRPLFIFNEGPPTANGKPGIHHVLARAFKDAFPRYKTMRGYYVPRKAGWDTHGLPVEHEIEKELGIFDKKEIESKVGIADFNKRCRESVKRYIEDWEKMTDRMGFWVNMEDAYYTLNNDYIESVWHLLKEIWNKDLIYRGYKVVPYDPRIGATLSSHELSLGYREVEDPSIYVRFRFSSEENTSFLVWTTTPWTLPSNIMLAVDKDIDYVFVDLGDETLVLAESLCETVLSDVNYKVIRNVKGVELIGLSYERLFDDIEVTEKAFKVFSADFVSTEEGTGIVHCAPAYGVDDLQLGKDNGLPVIHAIGQDGCFTSEVKSVAGMFFKDADKVLIKILKERGLLFYSGKYSHNYPFGWRTGDPIIYYAKNAWYIRTSQFRERMAELNKTINWVPSHIREGRFGKWLDNNVDWALSRERFWGTPLPVWTDDNDNYICVGSRDELERLTGKKLDKLDLHRPAVDKITFEKDGKTWSRVPEVIDCWFDSGAMSYAQWHYPFENENKFSDYFPADFICEAIDQTRGWFYTLHAISTLVSNDVAYRNCICLSHIVDEEGKKMSKSQGNIVDPNDVFDTIGADALRWYFLARLSPEVQKRVSVDIVSDVASSFINTFWNTYSFFVLYARLDKVDFSLNIAIEKRPDIDQWALALLNKTILTATNALDNYNAKSAGEAIEDFVGQLSNWYVRRNRRRFWKSTNREDQHSAYITLYECLNTVHKLMAPFTPFLSENVYQNLTRSLDPEAPLSIHMTEWPEVNPLYDNNELLFEIAVVQKVVGLARAARNQSNVRTRQPLNKLLIRVPDKKAANALSSHKNQVLEELNVKSIELIARDAGLVKYRIKPNLPRIGKKYGSLIPAIRETLSAMDGVKIARIVDRNESFNLDINDKIISLKPEDIIVETSSAEGYVSAEDGGYLAAIDINLDEKLIIEGMSRELVRTVQEARKKAGLEVSDRIILGIKGSALVETSIIQYRDLIMSETLAVQWEVNQKNSIFVEEKALEKERWTIEISQS